MSELSPQRVQPRAVLHHAHLSTPLQMCKICGLISPRMSWWNTQASKSLISVSVFPVVTYKMSCTFSHNLLGFLQSRTAFNARIVTNLSMLLQSPSFCSHLHFCSYGHSSLLFCCLFFLPKFTLCIAYTLKLLPVSLPRSTLSLVQSVSGFLCHLLPFSPLPCTSIYQYTRVHTLLEHINPCMHIWERNNHLDGIV